MRPAIEGTERMPVAPRTFKLTAPRMRGEDIKQWQQILNKQFEDWGVRFRVPLDSEYGIPTRDATATVLYGLGIKRTEMNNGVTPELRVKVRDRKLSPTERLRRVQRRAWRRKLREKFAGGGVAPPLAKIISSSWGWHPGVHDGVDLICPPNSPIFALCEAKVIDVRSSGWWGLAATPSHGHPIADGDGIIQLECLTDVGPFKLGLHFGYGHAEHAVVREGQIVKPGERLGTAGFADAWHVHFMVNRGNTMQGRGDHDPLPYVEYAVRHG
jgi:murein DD-endopeptidase MepM/ murein hydrolase activator NlpD